MLEGDHAQRLPFSFEAKGGIGRLTLEAQTVGPLQLDRLELEVTDLGTDPGSAVAERFQRRRTRLRSLALRLSGAALEERVEQVRRQLAGLGITQLQAKLGDGFVSVRARAADGLAAADLSFRVQLVNAGTLLRAVASTVRVHGHLPTPGPVIVDRILVALLGATDSAGVVERPRVRGLCDVEIDLVGALLWFLLPPSGWRLPAVGDIELVRISIGRGAVEVAFGPAGTRTGELGVRPQTYQLAAAHDLMLSADTELREGRLEEAMRGYRTLLAAGGPEQPLLLERILALAAARPAWFFDGLELSRQALGRWPNFPPAHAVLASVTLAQGDARIAAEHLTQLAQLASAEGDDDQAALAALAGARLLRVLDPKAATVLYQLALEHDPGSTEAADALADRFADEQRWPELVRLVRARAVITPDVARAVQLRLRLADVFVHQLEDAHSAQQELAVARHLAPDDPAVHEMTATILSTIDPVAAITAWRDVARLAELRGDHRTCARALAIVGEKVAARGETAEAVAAWQRALELDPLQADAIAGLAYAAAARDQHAEAIELFERLRGLGLAPHVTAKHELALARSLVAAGRTDDARASLRRATLAGGETAAEAHAVLAEVAEASDDRDHAATELDTAIGQLLELAGGDPTSERMYTRAAELAMARAALFDRSGQASAATSEWVRAHELAIGHAPQIARSAAQTMLARSSDETEDGTERRWIDAVLATRPPPAERAQLLVRRAAARRSERAPDMAAALADLHEALGICEAMASNQDGTDPEATQIRKQAYQLEAELLAKSGDQRARAQALAALAKMAAREERVAIEAAAAAAWLDADEPANALPHSARAHAALEPEVPAAMRREVLATLGEAAWRQRAWADVIRAYRALVEQLANELDATKLGTYRYRHAVAAERTGDADGAMTALRPLVEDIESAHVIAPELRGQALRLFADLAERAGDLADAATALEGFASLAVDSSPTARADAMYRAGELFRRADRADDAIRCLESALRISETHLPALDALELAWRERGDHERVSVILGRKVAATTRHPARQKPLLSRLGDLQAQLGRPDVALATHQRALEIDPTWRPSLRYVTLRLRDSGQVIAAAGGLAQLAGELPADAGVDLAVVARERQLAAVSLAELVLQLDVKQLDAVAEVARPALERASGDGADVSAALARLRGEVVHVTTISTFAAEENTASSRASSPSIGALSLKDAAQRARLAGKLDDALATLEAANHVNPGDQGVLHELVELATELGDHAAAARHLTALAELLAGARRGNALLELSELYFDHLDDSQRGRQAMRAAAEAFGSGTRRDATLRMLASEARAHLAWAIAVEALEAIEPARRTAADLLDLANALVRAGRDGLALALVEDPAVADKLPDGGELAQSLRASRDRKLALADQLEREAHGSEAAALRTAVDPRTKTLPGVTDDAPPAPPTQTLGRIKLVSVPRPQVPPIREIIEIDADDGFQSVSDPRVKSGPIALPIEMMASAPDRIEDAPADAVTLKPFPAVRPPADEDTPETTLRDLPVMSHDEVIALDKPTRTTLRDFPSVPPPIDPTAPRPTPLRGTTIPPLPRTLTPTGPVPIPRRSSPTMAPPTPTGDRPRGPSIPPPIGELPPIAPLPASTLREYPVEPPPPETAASLLAQAMSARVQRDLLRAAALLARAHALDPTHSPVWMPLADTLAASDEIDAARELYEKVAASSEFTAERRAFAQGRADALGHDDKVVSGEIKPRASQPVPVADLERAKALADGDDLKAAIAVAEQVARAHHEDLAALELLEQLYLRQNDVTGASDAIGRQLLLHDDEVEKAALWRRRAKLYRDAIGRDAEAYRCLKEAHACAPQDAEIAYQLRTAAMVRGEWDLVAALLYREIAAADSPRERGALHLELALIFDEKLEDPGQAQQHFEQALAHDPTIPAATLPLARRYEALGRLAEAAALYETAALTARPADRAHLLEAAQRCTQPTDLGAQLEQAEAAGANDAALDLAHQLWRTEPGHAVAFRVLATTYRATGDLAALTDITTVRASRADDPEERAAAWIAVARLAEEVGQFEQAGRAYDLALVEDPGHIEALDARGALAFREGDFSTADTIYRDLTPSETVLGLEELALRRSIISERLGRDSEALTLAQTAAEVAPGRRELVQRVQELATRIGELDTALAAARSVLDLVPLDDEEGKVRAHFALVELMREAGDLGGAVHQLERVLRDYPIHARALELLAELHMARGDWTTATRILYQLVPLAPTSQLRAERLYRLGEAVLVHLGDVDRADDVFLRASDLDPAHVPTLRRLLDVYWRADDPGALVEVAAELAERNALSSGGELSLAHALVAAALLGDTPLAQRIGAALGDDASASIASALGELNGRAGRFQLSSAATAITELARRGIVDLARVRAAAAPPVVVLLE